MTPLKYIIILVYFTYQSVFFIACADESSLFNPSSKKTQDQAKVTSELSALAFQDLIELKGDFFGDVLGVSNNPEDLRAYGVLSTTSPSFVTQTQARGAEGSPSPALVDVKPEVWSERFEGCELGELDRLNLYIAHILSSDHLRGGRRLSVVAQSTQAVTIKWSGELWTSAWSDLLGYKTVRPDWIGARVAQLRLNISEYPSVTKRTQLSGEGDWHVLETIRASSLVEGALHIEVEGGCAAFHVIAHDAPLETLPRTYAAGDVKWPGWYQGSGFGRAAGIYESSDWVSQASHEISQPKSAFGWKLFDATQSPTALIRHGDSAEILFGGYGAVFETQLKLSNKVSQCLEVTTSFASFAQLPLKANESPLGESRTLSVRDFERSDPQRRPTMLWNGPIEINQELSSGEWVNEIQNVILTPTTNRNDTDLVSGLVRPLFMWRLQPNEQRSMRIKIPVPGYIVAPAALVFETRACPMR